MNAFTRLQSHINRIHADMVMRGIHSQAILEATYCIETECRAFMDTGIHREWERCHFTTSHRKVGDLMLAHTGHIVSNEAIYDMLYSGYAANDLPDQRIVKVFIHHMRKRLKKYDSAYVIETVPCQGQRLVQKPSAFAIPEALASALAKVAA